MAGARGDFDAGSSDANRRSRVVQYDLNALADRFAAVAPSGEWSVAAHLQDVEVARHDDRAIGGDLAYQYALRGSFAASASTRPRRELINDQRSSTFRVLTAEGLRLNR